MEGYKKDGFALVVVLGFIAVLTALIWHFTDEMSFRLVESQNLLNELQAENLADEALKLACDILKYDLDEDSEQGQNIDFYVQGDFNPLDELWSQVHLVPMTFGLGEVWGVIVDERSKLNINCLAKRPPAYMKVFERLFEILEIDVGVLRPIQDWVDSDPYKFFGESHYASLNPPRKPRDAPLMLPSEIMLVDGINLEILKKLKGEGRVIDRPDPLSSPFITTFPQDCRRVDGGVGLSVNVNTAPLEVLMALFDISKDLAEEIIEMRTEQPFTDADIKREFTDAKRQTNPISLMDIPLGELYTDIKPTVNSDIFSVFISAKYSGVESNLVAVLGRSSQIGSASEEKWMKCDILTFFRL